MKYSTQTITTKSGKRATLALPSWEPLDTDRIVSDLTALLEEEKAIVERVAFAAPSSFAQLHDPFRETEEKLARFWGPVSHLNSTMQTDRLREAHDAGDELQSKYASEFAMHEGLYRAYLSYRDTCPEYGTLDPVRKKIIDDRIEDFELSGVGLSPEGKARLMEIDIELTQVANTIESNVKSAVAEWGKHVTDAGVLAGVPDSTKDAMRRAAEKKGLGGWYVTLHAPIYVPVMTHGTDRDLRKELFIAFVTRASDKGPQAGRFNNMPSIERILALRDEKAKLLGFETYADFALKKRMAPSVERVFAFEREIARYAAKKGKGEFADLRNFASEQLGITSIEPWDMAFASEQMKIARFDFSEEDLRPYFSEDRVFEGMFEHMRRLYGTTVRERTDVPAWTTGVRFFEVYDEAGELRGGIYADLYARDGKNQGAWMDACMRRVETGESTQLPVAYLNCNFTEPASGEKAQLLHGEVETTFHELGHVLHHVLGLTAYPEVSMMEVEWDAVEFPSQVNEQWCWNETMLQALSRHKETGKEIPSELCAKLIASKHFLDALAILRQLEFGLFDMELHAHYDPSLPILDVLKSVRKEVRVIPVYADDRQPASFTHIFSGGYAAGYYSYLWAEVLAADAFEAYLETGDIFDRKVGARFLHEVLEVGASRPFMESYRAFRGREPSVQALLRQRGLLEG